MIEKLKYQPDVDDYGNCYGLIPPSKQEIVDKINEVINYINEKETK